MLEILKSLIFAVIMVPIFIAAMLGLIYALGGLFNVISHIGVSKKSRQQQAQS